MKSLCNLNMKAKEKGALSALGWSVFVCDSGWCKVIKVIGGNLSSGGMKYFIHHVLVRYTAVFMLAVSDIAIDGCTAPRAYLAGKVSYRNRVFV